MEYKAQKKRLGEARALLLEPSASLEKFRKLRDTLYGVHLNLDDTLHILDVRASELGKLMGGDFLSTPFDKMPEATEDEKRRKQLVAEFGEGVGKLQNQVNSLEADLDAAHDTETKERKKWHFHNPFAFLKGPLIFLSGCFVFIVAMLYFTSSPLYILNNGCAPLPPMFKLPEWIPGFSLPQEPIESGARAYARLPGITYGIDATYPGTISVRVYMLNFPFDVTHFDDVQFDGATIIGRAKTLSAFWSGDHFLEIICKKE